MFSSETMAKYGIVEITVGDVTKWKSKTKEEKAAANAWDSLKFVAYIIHKPNGDPAYIGSTSVGIRKRLARHRWAYSRSIIGKAIDKMSGDDWKITLIPCVSKEDARLQEEYLLQQARGRSDGLLLNRRMPKRKPDAYYQSPREK